MAESSNGALDPELIERCIETGEGQTVSDIGGTSPKRWSTSYDKNKNFCILVTCSLSLTLPAKITTISLCVLLK